MKSTSMKPNDFLEEERDGLNYDVLLSDLLNGFRRFWWLYAVIVLLCAVWNAIPKSSYVPQYEASATFTVSIATDMAGTTDVGDSSSFYDSDAAGQLSTLFPYIVQSDLLRGYIGEYLGTDSFTGSISASSVAGTNLFTLTVTDSDPDNAKRVLEATIQSYPYVAQYILGETKLEMIDAPAVTDVPINPRSWKNSAAKGGCVGLGISAVLLLLYALTRRTIRRPDDIKIKLNHECLTAIPLVQLKKRKDTTTAASLISIENPHIGTPFLESIRSLRIRVVNDMQAHGDRILLITSTLPSEGKTTLSSNLADTLARSGNRVILVDGDLRRQCIKQSLGITTESPSPADVLRDRIPLTQALCPTEHANLRLLAGSGPVEAYSDVINSDDFIQLLRSLRQIADYVIIDTPPCDALSDAVSLARAADCALYIIRQDYAKQSHILNGLQELEVSDIRICGTVLNGTRAGLSGYAHGYGYGYGGYHSSRYGKYGYGESHKTHWFGHRRADKADSPEQSEQ